MKILELRHIIKEAVNDTLNPFKTALSGKNIIIYFKTQGGQEHNIEISNFKKSRGLSCGEDANIDALKKVNKAIIKKTRKSLAKKGYTDLDVFGSVGGGSILQRAISPEKPKPIGKGDPIPFGSCFDTADEFSTLLKKISTQNKFSYTGEIFEGELEKWTFKDIKVDPNVSPNIELGGLTSKELNKNERVFYIRTKHKDGIMTSNYAGLKFINAQNKK